MSINICWTTLQYIKKIRKVVHTQTQNVNDTLVTIDLYIHSMLNINQQNILYTHQLPFKWKIVLLIFVIFLDVNTMLHIYSIYLICSLFNGLNLSNGCENDFSEMLKVGIEMIFGFQFSFVCFFSKCAGSIIVLITIKKIQQKF